MSYEPKAHETQMSILRHMLFTKEMAFSEIQKKLDLTGDYTTFHIKQLAEAGYIEKIDGKYRLTADGKEYANRMDTDKKIIEKQPKLSVLVIVENNEGKLLAQQRLKQPYYGFWGRMTGKVQWGETLEQAASRELAEETGLKADFEYAGLYHKMDYTQDQTMLEDKYFIIMFGTNPKGDLISDGEGHHNEFLADEELLAKDKVFKAIPTFTKMAKKHKGSDSFIEIKHDYHPDDY